MQRKDSIIHKEERGIFISKTKVRILELTHQCQYEFDLSETEVRRMFLNICEDLAKDKVTEFRRGG